MKGLIFDLDGVITDTAGYHYRAWKEIAKELGIPFTKEDNERLKGVSRERSFEIILELGGRLDMPEEERALWREKKNEQYVSFLNQMGREDILPGVEAFISRAKEEGYRTGLGTASRNSKIILERLEITGMFDAVTDGTDVTKAKPDPEVFLKCAERLGISPEECIVFEDSRAGIEAAHRGGMKAVGIGKEEQLKEADIVIPGFAGADILSLERKMRSREKGEAL